ncbi:MAG: NUDIX domain-containing protein [Campylobacterales bacterium]|nr:NUDIX domain-containing protein [Campylobacterales bacterium]
MIPIEQFKIVVEFAPLVSVDLIAKYQNKILLGRRVNSPAKDFYFTTGSIIRKNETIKQAQNRVAKDELGIELKIEPLFLGVFEHFYNDSIFENISTHYLNIGYLLELDDKLDNIPKEQHSEYRWFDIDELLKSSEVHNYVKDYFKKV